MKGKIRLYNGDCLEIMKDIEDSSVDCVLCDLPYGTTKCSWDIIIPFHKGPLLGGFSSVVNTTVLHDLTLG